MRLIQRMNNNDAKRPDFRDIFIEFAKLIALRSTCRRLSVGTVITSTDFKRVLAIGYNGNAIGLPNICDRKEAGNCGCLHSEENAIINCNSLEPKYVFITHSPCVMCAKRLINLGNIRCIYYHHDYRDKTALDILSKANIQVEKW